MLKVLGERQQRLLETLRQAQAGLGVDALSRELGITVTAVRQHLAALELDGLVQKGESLPSGGRPQQTYVLSDHGQEIFPRQYHWFAEVLLESLLLAPLGSEATRLRLAELGARIGAELTDPARPFPERSRRLIARMRDLGYDAHDGDSAGENSARENSSSENNAKAGTKKTNGATPTPANSTTIVAHNCVFHKLAQQHPEVCAFDLALIGAATNSMVSHEECMARGGGCCRFRLQEKAAS